MQISIREMTDILEVEAIGFQEQELDIAVSICMDSRAYKQGDLFWPLAGERFDAHNFIESLAKEDHFMTVLNSNWLVGQSEKVRAYVPVENTSEALLKLAKGYAKRFGLHKIAITGSNGKTSTKDLIHSILSQEWSGIATEGNFNNHIGLPLSIFRFKQDHKYAILEMGTNHPGEIEVLSKTLCPDIAIITNIGQSHLEFFGDESAVFTEKMAIASGLTKGGTLVVNADDPYLSKIRNTKNYRVMTFGVNRGQFKPENLEWDENACASFQMGRTQFKTKVPGIHNLYNAMAAIAVAQILKLSKSKIKAGLEVFQGSALRMEMRESNGIRIAADCYNANPSSMKSALATIGSMKAEGRKVAVLGDMLELGNQSSEMHKDIGSIVAELGFDALFTLGEEANHIGEVAKAKGFANVKHFGSLVELENELQKYLQEGDIVLFKASRGMKLDVVANALSEVEIEK